MNTIQKTILILMAGISIMNLTTQPKAQSIDPIWREALAEPVDLNVEWLETIQCDGVTMRSLRYTGSIWNGQPQRIYALYAQPDGPGPFPAILQIHGGQQTCFPENIAMFGYACLSFDWWGSYTMNRPADKITNWSEGIIYLDTDPKGDYRASQLFHAGLAAIRGIDVLCAQPGVDAARIGVQGISWGGWLTWLVNGLDSRVKSATPTYGTGSCHLALNASYTGDGPEPPAWRGPWGKVFDPVNFVADQHGALMHINGTNDFFGYLPVADRQLAALKVDHRRSVSPNCNHCLSTETVEAALAWHDAHLKGDGRFPAEPTVQLAVDDKGMVTARIQADESHPVTAVRVDYRRGDMAQVLGCWLPAPASPLEPGVWTASIPLVGLDDTLSVIAQVTYDDRFTISSAVAQALPARDLPGAICDEKPTPVLTAWGTAPAGWAMQRVPDFFDPTMPGGRLARAILDGRPAMVVTGPQDYDQMVVSTHLPADPSREKGGTRGLEIWTHDVAQLHIHTNVIMERPECKTHHRMIEPGPGWHRTVVRLDEFKGDDGVADLKTWDGVYRLILHAIATPGGSVGIGEVAWVE